jgi:hypothetical protein
MPAYKITVRTLIVKEAESEIDKVPVPDNTVSMHVVDMSNDTEDQLSEILKNTNFSLQIESQQI